MNKHNTILFVFSILAVHLLVLFFLPKLLLHPVFIICNIVFIFISILSNYFFNAWAANFDIFSGIVRDFPVKLLLHSFLSIILIGAGMVFIYSIMGTNGFQISSKEYFFAITLVFLSVIGLQSYFTFKQFYVPKQNSVEEFIRTSTDEKILISDIALIKREENLLNVVLFNKEVVKVYNSLGNLMNTVLSKDFFRINREVVVNREAVEKWERIDQNNLEVTVMPIEELFRVTKKNVSGFKSWMKKRGKNMPISEHSEIR